MDWFLLILSSLTCFFILMGNFKISHVEELQKAGKSALEKEIETLQHEVYLLRSEWDSKIEALLGLSADPAGKTSEKEEVDRKMEKPNAQAELHLMSKGIIRMEKRLELIEKQLQTLTESAVLTTGSAEALPTVAANALSAKAQSVPKESKSVVLEPSVLLKIQQKYTMVSTDEKLFLKGLFRRTANEWHKTEEMGLDTQTAKFLIPMICRKLVFGGVPLIKMKDVSGSMKVLWGDGLKNTEIQEITRSFGAEDSSPYTMTKAPADTVAKAVADTVAKAAGSTLPRGSGDAVVKGAV